MDPVLINRDDIKTLDLRPRASWSERPFATTLRADARLPWLPLILERDNGSLIRHVAMVVPHSFSRSEGLRFDTQALELWITHRMMVLDDLCQRELGSAMRNNLSQVAASLGYELDHRFWDLLD